LGVGFKVKYYWFQVGHSDFLHSFFSTISYHLEPCGWGTKYPCLLKELYNGKLDDKYVSAAIKELEEIRERLKEYKPSEVIWDIDELEKKPPWGENISQEINDLSNYFITSEGEDLINLLLNALKKAKSLNLGIEIESI
jgi:hypothetical protein